ncbi:hypothetical protein NG895_06905 [Aeoliella sp. ICT_H6.2]|uniref:Uncharacterized protein n=1 Tax=Aeoliella straminimaris TaxID=2954799 RepID=A0A9X2JFT8_9BACT|nr:hypothetical protein [Aeoliella straminimaris]MCO6043632.1 hypothetical protein [Aeoliella straminimaris]
MFGDQLGPILMFLLGIALLTSILLRRTYRQVGRRRKGFDNRPIDAQPRPKTEWDGAKHDSVAVIEKQKVQLAQMSRDVNGQLDTKIMILRDLIARSEQQIERLEELLGETQNV